MNIPYCSTRKFIKNSTKPCDTVRKLKKKYNFRTVSAIFATFQIILSKFVEK
mgnify:FL=1